MMRVRLAQPWTPNIDVAPMLVPALASKSRIGQSFTPIAAPAAAPSGTGVAVGLGAAAVTLGVASLGVLFSYGVAKESKSKLVKTTGYILAGLGGLVAIVDAAIVGTAVAKSI